MYPDKLVADMPDKAPARHTLIPAPNKLWHGPCATTSDRPSHCSLIKTAESSHTWGAAYGRPSMRNMIISRHTHHSYCVAAISSQL